MKKHLEDKWIYIDTIHDENIYDFRRIIKQFVEQTSKCERFATESQ